MLNGDIVISIKELIEIYKDEIVCPKKSSSDFIGFLSRSFDLSEITVAEIDPVTRGALSKRWLSENNTVWMLKNNKKSATFYKYHHDRFYNKSHIYSLVNSVFGLELFIFFIYLSILLIFCFIISKLSVP